MTCSVWFRIQRIIKKYSGYYSASGSGFKTVQGIIQRLVQYSGYYSKCDQQRLVQDSVYYSKTSRVLFSVWFCIQRINKKCPGYYSESGSRFSVLFKNVQGIIQRLVQYSGYYSNYDLQRLAQGYQKSIKNVQGIIQRLVQDSGYY